MNAYYIHETGAYIDRFVEYADYTKINLIVPTVRIYHKGEFTMVINALFLA